MTEQIERRERGNDRRKGDRRAIPEYVCDVCGGGLVYLLPEKLMSNECYECRLCGQKYVVLKFKGKRDQLARVENV